MSEFGVCEGQVHGRGVERPIPQPTVFLGVQESMKIVGGFVVFSCVYHKFYNNKYDYHVQKTCKTSTFPALLDTKRIVGCSSSGASLFSLL